jgi:hypothetical protein
MANKKRHTVDSWVEDTITEVIEGKPCSAIALLHLKGVGGATEEITTKPIEGTVNAHDIAENLIGRAEGFSQDIGGLQTFKLIAFYGTNEPHNPFHFTASDGSVVSRSETVMSAHEPTPTGVLGQQMKHIEQLIAYNNQLVNSNMATANGIVSMCFGPQGVIQESIRAQLEAIAVVKDAMLDMQKERKQLILEEHKAAQDLQTRKAIIDAIPQLANRFTGHEIFNENTNRAKILETLAFKITPQDMELLVAMGKLTKEESLVLSAQFAAIIEEKRKESEALKAVPSEESTALATVNGSSAIQRPGNGGLS